MLSSLQEPEAANTNLQQKISQATEGEYEESGSEEGSKIPSFTSCSDASLKKDAAQVQKAVKGGRWFETPRGSLKRIDIVEKLHDGLDRQGSISSPGSCFSESKEGSSKTSETSSGDENLVKVSDFQLLFPNHNRSEAVNHFHMPDVDENEEEYDIEAFTENDNRGDGDELEDGEISEELRSFVDDECNGEGEESESEEGDGAGVTDEPNHGEIVDSGHFALGEMCVALGNGSLDEKRMTRLKEGFMALLDDAVGRHMR